MKNFFHKIFQPSVGMVLICFVTGLSFSGQSVVAAKAPSVPATSQPRDYHFDKTISRAVLENFLSRSISMEGVFNGHGDLDDNIRMIKSIGAKYRAQSLSVEQGGQFLEQH
jgi:hypothetical protein